MKRNKILIMIAFVIFCFATCLVGCGKVVLDVPAIESVIITNKAALQSVWYEGGEDRTIELSLSPNDVLIENTDFEVKSNRPQIISVGTDGKTLKAVKAGTATVTVTVDDKSDSVLITVKPVLKEVTITNKTELSALWVQGDGERSVDVSLKPDAFTEENTEVKVTSSDPSVISVDGKKLTSVAFGKSTITVTAGNYSDSIEIEVIALSNPEIELIGDTTVNGFTDSEIELPVLVTSCDGKDLSEYVTAECNNSALTYNKAKRSVIVSEKGDYVLTLNVADPRDESKTAVQSFTVKAYRNVFNAVDGYGMASMDPVFNDGKDFVEDAEQEVYFNRNDATFAQFDMKPGKVYYAEVTLTSALTQADWSTFYGMTHSVKGDTTRWLTSFIDRGDAEGAKGARNFRVKYSDMREDNEWWNLNEGTSRTPLYYSYRIYQCRELNDGGDAFPVTLAVARIDDMFYSFVNGDYVNAVTNKNFADVDTVAGVYQQSAIRANYTDIQWLTGDQAKEKVNALTENGKKMVSPYVIDEGAWCEGSHNYNNKNFTTGEVTAEKGINYTFTNSDTDWNGGMVSPYLYFDGDFTFEWTFKFDKELLEKEQKGLMRIWLDVRSYKYQDECVRFGAAYGKKDSPDQSHLFAETVQGEKYEDFWHFNGTDNQYGSWWNGSWANTAHKFKFTISRICMGDKARFIMKWTAIDQGDGIGEGQSDTFVWDWDGYNNYGGYMWDPCAPVILLWHHVGITGECTNINWSVLHNSVEITNKDELTLAWEIGGTDRTVEWDVGFEGNPVTVTSSNPEVVKVGNDGKTLTAIGAGEATITVSVGNGVKDEITITVAPPALQSVSITNKDTLQEKWLLGDNAREIKFVFDPAEYWDENNANYTITSSNDKIISVNGKTLTAVGAGTATITVTANGKSDTVEITVRPVLTDVTIDNKAELQNKWVTGDSDRTINITLSPSDYWNTNNTTVKIESSDSNVIAVDEATGKLKAIGEGTATITVSVGSVSDSVTISVENGLRAIEITNKDALTALWLVNGADRTLTYKLNPEGFSLDVSEITVTSDNEQAVKVDGFTIKAVGAGSATITVTARGRSDTVTVLVRPELASVSITNKTALGAEWKLGDAEREIGIAFDSADYWNENNTDYTITSSNEGVVNVSGKTLTAVGKGNATITVTAQGKVATVEISVTIGNPAITIDGDVDTIYIPVGTSALPAFTANNYEGDDISGSVTVTCTATTLTVNGDNTLTATETGTYTVTLTVADGRDSTKTATKNITVKVMRNIFGEVNGVSDKLVVSYEQGDEYVADKNQVVRIDGHDNKMSFGQFDMQPSKQYYASVTFTSSESVNAYLIYGMTHSVKDAANKQLTFFIDRGDADGNRTAKIKFFDMTDGDWQNVNQSTSKTPIYQSNQIHALRGLDTVAPFPVKFETIRNGDFFYFFINGSYVMGCTDKNLKDKDTLPGIFHFAWITTDMTAIEWLEGSDAVAKLNALTDNGNKLLGKYRHSDWVSTQDSSFVVNGADAGNVGFAFNNKNADWNDGLLSQHMYFDGDFTYEWTYKFTDADSWSRMTLNIANYNSTSAFIEYGAIYDTQNKDNSSIFVQTTKNDNAKYATGYNWNNTAGWGGNWGGPWQNSPEKIKFKVMRICTSDTTARYVFTITALNPWNGNGYDQNVTGNSVSWVFDWDGVDKDGNRTDPCGAVILNFGNYKQSGICSDIAWTADTDVPEYGSNTAYHFDKDFTFEFDYEFAAGESGSDSWDKSLQLTINNSNGGSAAKFAISPMANGNCCVGLQILNTDDGNFEDTGGAWASTITDKYKVKIVRKCNEDGSVNFVVKVWKNGTELILDKNISRSKLNGWDNAQAPVNVLMYNSGINGTISNITWSNTAVTA